MVRLGVIGGGIYGTNILKAFKQSERKGLATLVALADIDDKKLEQHERTYGVRGYQSYGEMLEKERIDAVAIATPDFLHREIAVAAADAKKHIFVQKPLDVTQDGCEQIISAAKRNQVLLEVDFHKRYDPAHRGLKEAVQKGKLGIIEYGYAWMEDTIEVPTEWLRSWAAKSSPAWFLGVHYFDLVRWIINSDPKRIYATGVRGKLQELGINTFDSIQTKIEFKNGSHFTFDCSWILPKSFESIVNQGLRIVGTDGIWEIDAQNRGIETCTAKDYGMKALNFYFIREETGVDGNPVYYGYGIDSIVQFVEHVVYLQDGGELGDLDGAYASGRDGLVSAMMAFASEESIRLGRIIDFEEEFNL